MGPQTVTECPSIIFPNSRTSISILKCKIYFPLSSEKRTLNQSLILFLLGQGKILLTFSRVQEWLDIRHVTTVAHFLKTSVPGGSDTRLVPLLVKLLQLLDSTFLDNPLKVTVIPVACAQFSLSVNFLLIWSNTALWKQPGFSAMTFCDLHKLEIL